MPDYNLTRFQTGLKNSVDEALEDLETQLETVDNAKTIRGIGVMPTGRDKMQCVGWAIYDT
jgi:hypothetical protein